MIKKNILITKKENKNKEKIYLIQWHVIDYKAAIILQNHLGTKIIQQPYLRLTIKNKITDFPIFSFLYKDDQYCIVSNYVDNNYLHPEFKGIDFFLIPNNDIDDGSWGDIYHTIKNITTVSGIYSGNEKTAKFVYQLREQMQLNKI